MDPDKIRQVLFPNLTPEQFADMVARQQAEFADLRKEVQDQIGVKVDQMGEDLESAKQRISERVATNQRQ